MAGSIVVGDVDSRGVVRCWVKFSVSVDGQGQGQEMRESCAGAAAVVGCASAASVAATRRDQSAGQNDLLRTYDLRA